MTTQSYKEQNFEEHITEHLIRCGYQTINPSTYDKTLCLIPNEVIGFIIASQPQEYQKLQQQYGADTDRNLCNRLAHTIEKEGTLHALRKGISDRGCKFRFAFFKPSNKMNPDHALLYGMNRFTIVRQLKYSTRNENTIDITIFINGIPIITAELKNSLTGQFVQDAVKQYKTDRDPRAPLLQYRRCLVHFAVGNEEVFMTTRLHNEKTYFLPFNKDLENPVNPNGHKTAYLWEDILQPDTLLDLISNYLHIHKTTEKVFDPERGLVEVEKETLIFPRFHQLDAVRKILEAVRAEGAGKNYLIQHSAGSGKSNSIAWLAHQLASLYRKQTDKDRLFDSILVLTDRRNLDKQLRNTIKQFEQTTGVVFPVEINSQQLKEALEKGKDIIVSTLQKFPVISKTISELKGQRFAVIIDEVHSSMSGETSKHLKKVLSGNLESAEKEDEENFDIEDVILDEIAARGKSRNISYFGFTATPKNKTFELFGRQDSEGRFVPFHLYSMKQAIEEGFILDVLQNYTTFKRYFKLIKKVEVDNEYSKRKAMRVLTSYVDLQPHAIEMKARIMLEHFLEKSVHSIKGRGRAMIVCRSRLHAKKFFETIKRLMNEMNLPFKPLVAYSGIVEEMTENNLNCLPPRVSIEDAYKTPAYRILVVANKFQTGFDEPLLHTMYVDKKLAGIHAVQTLSRLNRTAESKTNTMVLDFVNDPEDILTSFQPYYESTFLEEETDPNKLYDLQQDLEQYEIFTKSDVEEFAAVFFNTKIAPEKMMPILDRVVHTFRQKAEDEREEFRGALQSFARMYAFISQIITFKDVELEKLYVFCQHLNRKLPRRDNHLPYELKNEVELHSLRIQKTYEGSITLVSSDGGLSSIKPGIPKPTEDFKDILTNILKILNETYGIEFTEEDRVDLERIKQKLSTHEELNAVLENEKNTRANKKYKFDEVFDALILDFVHTKLNLYDKLTKKQVNDLIKTKWFEEQLEAYQKRVG